MSFQISLRTLAAIADGALQISADGDPDITVSGLSTDTRYLPPQAAFLALKGDRFDGHEFVEAALAQGAVAAIVQTEIAALPHIRVADTLAAYQKIARWWRQTLATPIVAITGSVGKTTTKELVSAALATTGKSVLKTQANYNNEIGVPKTLLSLEASHGYGVVEMGMRGPGQIAELTQIARPDVAVITNVGTAHIELLGSEQAIADAKCELLAELDPTGIAVLNYDNPRLMATASRVWSDRQITFGLSGGDIQGRLLDADTLEVKGQALPLPLPGRHNAINFLAAIAVMEAFELDWTKLSAGLPVTLPSGRSQRWQSANDIMLLDETYNAGVESMKAALHLLKETPGQRHIAVLGTMKELGEHSVPLHEQVGQEVRHLQLDHLFTLAEPAETAALAEGAQPVPVEAFTDPQALQTRLAETLRPGDRVLFKASRAVALDQVVNHVQQALSNPR